MSNDENDLIAWSGWEVLSLPLINSHSLQITISGTKTEIILWSAFPIMESDIDNWFMECVDGTISMSSKVVALKHPPGTLNNEMIVLKKELE